MFRSRAPAADAGSSSSSTSAAPLIASEGAPAAAVWPSPEVRSMLKVAGIILTEASLSIGLNFYNSFLLRNVPGFKFPVIYTAVHMVTSFLGSTVLIVFFGAATVSFAQMRESLLRIALLALLRVASITTNNWSLEYIDLTLNKVIKASAPVFTVALSVLWERKVYSARKIAALGVLALGTMLSCLSRDASAESFTGVVLALVSAAVGGSSLVVSAMLLGRGSGAPLRPRHPPPSPPPNRRRLTPAPVVVARAGLGPVALLFYFSPIQTAVLGALIPFTELAKFVEWAKGENLGSAIGYILVGALLSFGFNIMGFILVKNTSSVTAAMLGNLKIVIVIVFAAALMGAAAEPVNIVGYCFSVLAACSYTGISLDERGQLHDLTAALGCGKCGKCGCCSRERPADGGKGDAKGKTPSAV